MMAESLLDPYGMVSSLWNIHRAWLQKPQEVADMLSKWSTDVFCAGTEEAALFLFESVVSGESPDVPMNEFLGMVNRCSRLSHKYYAACSRRLREYVNNAPGMDKKEKRRCAFWTDQFISALSPANFFWTNPSAVQRLVDSGGRSLLSGFENWLEDAKRGDRLVKIVDTGAFKVGVNLAYTPGCVVFRNKLMEVIQYSPETEAVHAVPVVFIPPWINKYYVFDLDREKSIVRFLLKQNLTVFIVSWRNPTAEMRGASFDDYVFDGALKAVEVARDICRVDQVHAAGYCIGGTLLTALLAWLSGETARGGNSPIRHSTLLATMVDFSDPGELGVFLGESCVAATEELMERDGYLDKNYLETVFRLLRSNRLIWRYYAHNYLQGRVPPKSDFLYWKSDCTRVPEALGSFFLREFYLNNKLARKGVWLGEHPLDLGHIDQPLYVVGAELDHICPWKATFRIRDFVRSPVRFTLAQEGHITGFVNPPSARARKKYWSGEVKEQCGWEEWESACEEHSGSWWTDWVKWLSERCDAMVEPPDMGSEKYPPLEKAPGSYVLEP